MNLFKFCAGSTMTLMLLAVTIALLIRYDAYLSYVGMGVVILVVIVTGLGLWYLVEKILNQRHQRVEQQRRLELEQKAQSVVERREQSLVEVERLRAQGDYLKAAAEATALQMTVEQYREGRQAGLYYPGPHGSPVHISMDPVTGQPQIRSTDYRALLPQHAGQHPIALNQGQTPAQIQGQAPAQIH